MASIARRLLARFYDHRGGGPFYVNADGESIFDVVEGRAVDWFADAGAFLVFDEHAHEAPEQRRRSWPDGRVYRFRDGSAIGFDGSDWDVVMFDGTHWVSEHPVTGKPNYDGWTFPNRSPRSRSSLNYVPGQGWLARLAGFHKRW